MTASIKMNVRVVLAVTIVGFVATQNPAADELQGVDFQKILNDGTIFNNLIECLRDLKPCTELDAKIKGIIPGLMKTDCAVCTNAQKGNALEIIETVLKTKPDVFLQLEKVYDPDHEFRKRHGED